MRGPVAPIVILEPQGLAIYEEKCHENNWDIFKIYVNLVEGARIDRLLSRVIEQVHAAFDSVRGSVSNSTYGRTFHDVAIDKAKYEADLAIKDHQRRLRSILGEERRWQSTSSWDAIVPGDNVEKAIEMIRTGIEWRNRKNSPPVGVGAVTLPIL
jgi:hypothetical protein